ncbi:putative oxidoreductase [Morchella snyderi]|nr:putative oxidoreductase [Morchella snyderi]
MTAVFRTVVKTWRNDVYPFISPTAGLSNTAAGKTIIVTGSGRGIGKAVAQAFAQAGASKIILTGRTTSDLLATKKLIEEGNLGVKVFAYTLDVSKDSDAVELFANVKRDAGVPDVLVNNAGVAESGYVPLAQSDPLGWWSVWEINVKGTYLCAREFINAVKAEGRGGTIINTSSIGAAVVTPTMSSYQTGKLALIKFTEFIEVENGKDGIRAFSYHPGGIITDIVKQPPLEIRHMFQDTVELAAGTVLYLASERSEYLRGRFIIGNWDMEELEQRKDEIVQKDLFKSGIQFI